MIGIGIYSPADAARLLRERPATVRRWAFGYARARGEERRTYPPFIVTDLPEIEGQRALTFVEVVELMFVRGLVGNGVPWRLIKEAAKVAARICGTAHPFAMRAFLADPAGVYAELREKDGSASLVELVGHGQGTLAEVVRPYLGQLDFSLDDLAARWWPMGRDTGVVVDPEFAFGAPIVAETGVRTEVLAGAYEAERDQRTSAEDAVREVAWLYEVQPEEVETAIQFEQWLKAA